MVFRSIDLEINFVGMLPCFSSLEFYVSKVYNRYQGIFQGAAEPPLLSPVRQYITGQVLGAKQQYPSLGVVRTRGWLRKVIWYE